MYWQKRAKPSKRGFSQAWAHRLLTCSDWARRRLFKVKLSESPPSSACLVDGNAASISAKKGAGGSRASPWPSPPWNCWRRWFITHLGPSQFIAGRWMSTAGHTRRCRCRIVVRIIFLDHPHIEAPGFTPPTEPAYPPVLQVVSHRNGVGK